jgi:hypothetical protein
MRGAGVNPVQLQGLIAKPVDDKATVRKKKAA